MKHLACCAALALFSAWTLSTSGCKKAPQAGGQAAAAAAAALNPSAATAKPAPASGGSGELQNIAANWRELGLEMGKERVAFKIVAAKAWSIAGSVDQIMKLAEQSTGSPAVPPKGASAEEVGKVAFAVGLGDVKVPDAFHDVELIGINAKNLAVAAGGMDVGATRKWWTQLDRLCQGVCAGVNPPPPAPAGK